MKNLKKEKKNRNPHAYDSADATRVFHIRVGSLGKTQPNDVGFVSLLLAQVVIDEAPLFCRGRDASQFNLVMNHVMLIYKSFSEFWILI